MKDYISLERYTYSKGSRLIMSKAIKKVKRQKKLPKTTIFGYRIQKIKRCKM